jgi:hypothetical protein
VPLGGAQKERGLAAAAASSAIHAFLRPEVPEPQPIAVPLVAPPTTAPLPAAPEPAPRKEIKPDPQPRADRAPANPAAVSAPFFDPSQLTERPKPLTEPPLELMHSVLARAGTVQLVLSIDETGAVTAVDIDSASLPPAAAQRAAAIFAGMRFSPGRIDGTPVRSRVRITVGAEDRQRER